MKWNIPREIIVGDRLAQRDILSEHRGVAHHAGNWPMVSDAMGVHPGQIREAMATDQKLGVRAEYTRDGSVIFESPAHRKRYCEAHGVFDRNGGYSDPQRRNG